MTISQKILAEIDNDISMTKELYQQQLDAVNTINAEIDVLKEQEKEVKVNEKTTSVELKELEDNQKKMDTALTNNINNTGFGMNSSSIIGEIQEKRKRLAEYKAEYLAKSGELKNKIVEANKISQASKKTQKSIQKKNRSQS